MTQAAYFFSTLLTALLSPLGLFLGANVLTMTVPLSWLKKRRRGIALLLTLLFAFACTDFCGKTLLSFLEHLAERQPALNGQKSVADERRGSTLMLSGIEAPVMARWLGDTPFLMEPYSLNTRENVRESAKLLRRLYPDEKTRPAVCLVTDRFHTTRAMLCARSLMADFEVCASPAPSLVRSSQWRLFHFIPTGAGLAVTSMAWREMLALMRDWLKEISQS